MKNRPIPRFRTFVVLGLPALALATVAGPASGQEARTAARVHDPAAMFSKEAVQKADEMARDLQRVYQIPLAVETIESLQGQPIRAVTMREARKVEGGGIFILLSKRDTKIDVEFSERYQKILGRPDSEAITHAFVEEFRKGSFDNGLIAGINEVGKLLAKAKEDGRPFPAAPQAGLVERNRVRLTLDGAREILAGATAKAKALNLKVNIAVVDDGGHLIAFERMDGARPASGYTATTKAVSAATFRAPTGPLPSGAAAPDLLLNLSLQNAASASGGKLTTLLGGVPVTVDDQVIAGVGVGGGTGEQDAQVARAGIDAFLAEVGGNPPAAKP